MDSVKKIASILAIAFAGALLALFINSKINAHSGESSLKGTTPTQLTNYIAPEGSPRQYCRILL